MKRNSIHLLIPIFVICFLNVHIGRSQTEGSKTVFWEISGNGLEQNSYLFGTIHIIPKAEFEKFSKADNILKDCDQLILEMAIDVPFSQQLEWAKQLILPGGESLQNYMIEEDFIRLKSYAIDSLQIKESSFKNYLRLKPFAFYSALIPNVIGKKIESYELHFSRISKKKLIPVAELESFEIQLAIFDSISNEDQLKMFFSEDLDLKKEMEALLRIYKSQDIYEMASLINDDKDEYANFENELITQRNKNWVIKLDALMKKKSSFIAVGAGHLAGENGLIKLLRESGYSVDGICLISDCEL